MRKKFSKKQIILGAGVICLLGVGIFLTASQTVMATNYDRNNYDICTVYNSSEDKCVISEWYINNEETKLNFDKVIIEGKVQVSSLEVNSKLFVLDGGVIWSGYGGNYVPGAKIILNSDFAVIKDASIVSGTGSTKVYNSKYIPNGAPIIINSKSVRIEDSVLKSEGWNAGSTFDQSLRGGDGGKISITSDVGTIKNSEIRADGGEGAYKSAGSGNGGEIDIEFKGLLDSVRVSSDGGTGIGGGYLSPGGNGGTVNIKTYSIKVTKPIAANGGSATQDAAGALSGDDGGAVNIEYCKVLSGNDFSKVTARGGSGIAGGSSGSDGVVNINTASSAFCSLVKEKPCSDLGGQWCSKDLICNGNDLTAHATDVSAHFNQGCCEGECYIIDTVFNKDLHTICDVYDAGIDKCTITTLHEYPGLDVKLDFNEIVIESQKARISTIQKNGPGGSITIKSNSLVIGGILSSRGGYWGKGYRGSPITINSKTVKIIGGFITAEGGCVAYEPSQIKQPPGIGTLGKDMCIHDSPGGPITINANEVEIKGAIKTNDNEIKIYADKITGRGEHEKVCGVPQRVYTCYHCSFPKTSEEKPTCEDLPDSFKDGHSCDELMVDAYTSFVSDGKLYWKVNVYTYSNPSTYCADRLNPIVCRGENCKFYTNANYLDVSAIDMDVVESVCTTGGPVGTCNISDLRKGKGGKIELTSYLGYADTNLIAKEIGPIKGNNLILGIKGPTSPVTIEANSLKLATEAEFLPLMEINTNSFETIGNRISKYICRKKIRTKAHEYYWQEYEDPRPGSETCEIYTEKLTGIKFFMEVEKGDGLFDWLWNWYKKHLKSVETTLDISTYEIGIYHPIEVKGGVKIRYCKEGEDETTVRKAEITCTINKPVVKKGLEITCAEWCAKGNAGGSTVTCNSDYAKFSWSSFNWESCSPGGSYGMLGGPECLAGSVKCKCVKDEWKLKNDFTRVTAGTKDILPGGYDFCSKKEEEKLCTQVNLSNPIITPSTPEEEQTFTITCPTGAGVGYIDCVKAYANGDSEQCSFDKWNGNSAVFNCSGLAVGNYTAKCKTITNTASNCCASQKTKSYTVAGAEPPPDPSPGQISIALSQGWNMISSPLSVDLHLSQIEESCSLSDYAGHKVWHYNPQTNQWENPSFLTVGIGYYVYADSGYSIPLEGDSYSFSSLPVYTGWNMVGGMDENLDSIKGNCDMETYLGYQVWYYNPRINGWEHPVKLELGKGYYIAVKQDCELTKGASSPPMP